VQIERQRTFRRRGPASKVEREVGFAITSLPVSRAEATPLAATLRAHWDIENRAHSVRDVVFDEDRCQVRSGAAPQVLAASCNLAIALVRRAGYPCIAAALHALAGRPACTVQLVVSAGYL
jgi:hypothetical protein